MRVRRRALDLPGVSAGLAVARPLWRWTSHDRYRRRSSRNLRSRSLTDTSFSRVHVALGLRRMQWNVIQRAHWRDGSPLPWSLLYQSQLLSRRLSCQAIRHSILCAQQNTGGLTIKKRQRIPAALPAAMGSQARAAPCPGCGNTNMHEGKAMRLCSPKTIPFSWLPRFLVWRFFATYRMTYALPLSRWEAVRRAHLPDIWSCAGAQAYCQAAGASCNSHNGIPLQWHLSAYNMSCFKPNTYACAQCRN